MTHSYKILSADVTNGTFIIEFEGKRALNFWIPHNESGFLTGAELEQAIQTMYPQELEVESRFASFTNGSEIEALIDPVVKAQAEEQKKVDSVATLRKTRDAVLSRSDWTQLPDAPLTAEQKAEWATYRQALRDITEQAGFPEAIDWPVAP